MDRTALEEACKALPLFPLSGVVLMPGNLLPLHVFEPRYRQLVRDCLGSGGPLSVPQINPSAGADPGPAPPILPFAGVGFITAHQERSDGRYDIVLEPLGRVRIVEELKDTGHPYRVGRAELLEDSPVVERDLAREGERVRGLFGALLARSGPKSQGMLRALGSVAPTRVPDAMAAMAFRDDEMRQAFLAENDPLRRAHMVEDAVLMLLAEAPGGTVAEA